MRKPRLLAAIALALAAVTAVGSAVVATPASAAGYDGHYGDAWIGGKWGQDYYTYAHRSADLKVTASGPAQVKHGEEYLYTVDVTNRGKASATRVGLVSQVPAGFTYLAHRVDHGSATEHLGATIYDGGRIVADFGTLRPGETARLQIAGTAPGFGGGTMKQLNDTWTSSPETELRNNHSTVATTIR
ncbi:hypothetical protein [Streptacidiphilus sp. PAMC 29251]